MPKPSEYIPVNLLRTDWEELWRIVHARRKARPETEWQEVLDDAVQAGIRQIDDPPFPDESDA